MVSILSLHAEMKLVVFGIPSDACKKEVDQSVPKDAVLSGPTSQTVLTTGLGHNMVVSTADALCIV